MHAYQTSYAADDGSHPWSLNESCLQASTILSLDLCPEFMRDGVGQASFLFHISQGFLPILEIEVLKNQNQDKAGLISHLEIDKKCEMDLT